MLIALGGEAVVASKTGQRRVPLDEFFVDYFETVLQPGEVLLSVDLPPLRRTRRLIVGQTNPRKALPRGLSPCPRTTRAMLPRRP